MLMLYNCFKLHLVGSICTDLVDIQQDGEDELGRDRLGIVPALSFTCNGRITRIIARVSRDNNMDRNGYPYFQVWRPSSTNSMVYTNIGEVQLQESQVSQCNSNDYCNVNIILTGNNRIEFQSGDVVGYYHPDQTIYQVTTIRTNGYVLYRIDESPVPTTVNLDDANRDDDQRQPLIQHVIGKGIELCWYSCYLLHCYACMLNDYIFKCNIYTPILHFLFPHSCVCLFLPMRVPK